MRRQRVLGQTRLFGRLNLMMCLMGLLSLGLVLNACRARTEAQGTPPSIAQMHLTISPQPPVVGPAHLDLTLASPDGTPLSGAKLQVRGQMTMAGMAPVLADLTDEGNGHYQTGRFHFTMVGDWVLTITGNLSDGTVIRKTFAIAGVKER